MFSASKINARSITLSPCNHLLDLGIMWLVETKSQDLSMDGLQMRFLQLLESEMILGKVSFQNGRNF
jgi:hypothetical protein